MHFRAGWLPNAVVRPAPVCAAVVSRHAGHVQGGAACAALALLLRDDIGAGRQAVVELAPGDFRRRVAGVGAAAQRHRGAGANNDATVGGVNTEGGRN